MKVKAGHVDLHGDAGSLLPSPEWNQKQPVLHIHQAGSEHEGQGPVEPQSMFPSKRDGVNGPQAALSLSTRSVKNLSVEGNVQYVDCLL